MRRLKALPLIMVVLNLLYSSPTDAQTPDAALSYSLPQKITTQELELISNRLSLSEAQAKFLESSHRTYEDSLDDLNDMQGSIARLSIEGASGRDRQTAVIRANFRAALSEYQRKVKLADNSFLAELSTILTDDQLVQLDRVRWWRDRKRVDRILFMIPAARIDLTGMLAEMDLDDEQYAKLDPILLEYERSLTPMTVRADELLRKSLVVVTQLLSEWLYDDANELRDPKSPEYQRSYQFYKAQSIAVQTPIATLLKQIADLNGRTVTLLCDELPDAYSRHLRNLYLSRAYPTVHPDISDPEQLYLELLGKIDPASDHHEALTTLWADYRPRYQAICTKMEHEFSRWWEDFAKTNGPSWTPQYHQTMFELQFRRHEVNDKFIDQMVELLPEEVRLASQEPVERFRKDVKRRVELMKPRVVLPAEQATE